MLYHSSHRTPTHHTPWTLKYLFPVYCGASAHEPIGKSDSQSLGVAAGSLSKPRGIFPSRVEPGRPDLARVRKGQAPSRCCLSDREFREAFSRLR